MAYILSLLREPVANANESTMMEEEGDESDVEDGDITMLNTEVTFQSREQKYSLDFFSSLGINLFIYDVATRCRCSLGFYGYRDDH